MSEDRLIRLKNLQRLAAARTWGPANFMDKAGRTYSYWYDLLGGKKPSFGEKAARSIEEGLDLPRLWLDQVDADLRRAAGFRANDTGVARKLAGGDDGGMLERITKLEESMNQVKTELTVLSRDVSGFKAEAFRAFATKEDLANAKNSIIVWVVGAIFIAQLLPAVPALLRGLHLIT